MDELPPPQEERRYLAALILALSRPRLAGSPGARATGEVIRRELEAIGYEIVEHPFSFSGWPARFTVPSIGGIYLGTTLGAAGLLLEGRRGAAGRLLILAPPLLGGVAALSSALVGTLTWGRVDTANWLAIPRGGRLRYLIVAHRDSKSQPVSTLARSLSVTIAVGAWIVLLAAALSPAPGTRLRRSTPGMGRGSRRSTGHARIATTLLAAGAALVAGGTLLRCGIGNESPGALDNASGLAALLGVARRERRNGDVALLVTDGEELWLAGARVAAESLPPADAVINLDGLDDGGRFFLIERYGWPPRASAPHLADAIAAAAAGLGLRIERRGLPLGVLTDHLPLARAGYPAVTIMRGGRGSLRRVHRPSDEAAHLTGEGVQLAVRLVCAALDRIRRTDSPRTIASGGLQG